MKNLFKFLFLLSLVVITGVLLVPDMMPTDSSAQLAVIGFSPIFAPCGIENMGGWQNRLAFIPACHVTTVPMLPVNPATDEDLVTASGAFEFKDESGQPMFIYATDKTVKYSTENQGETDGQSFKITGEFFHPGTAIKAAAFARKVNNTSGYLILLSPEGDQYMVGQPGLPCTIKPSFEGGQARTDRRGFKFTFEADSYAPYVKLGVPIDFDALSDESEPSQT